MFFYNLSTRRGFYILPPRPTGPVFATFGDLRLRVHVVFEVRYTVWLFLLLTLYCQRQKDVSTIIPAALRELSESCKGELPLKSPGRLLLTMAREDVQHWSVHSDFPLTVTSSPSSHPSVLCRVERHNFEFSAALPGRIICSSCGLGQVVSCVWETVSISWVGIISVAAGVTESSRLDSALQDVWICITVLS